jgi:methylthioribose-1-phosphate isomerase
MTQIKPVYREGRVLCLLDQRLLPGQEKYLEYRNSPDVAVAIKDMVVRGAPAIGIAAAYGMALAACNATAEAVMPDLMRAAKVLIDSRPTAVNLSWAVRRMLNLAEEIKNEPIAAIQEAMLLEADAILEEDIRMNRTMGACGATLIPDKATVMTHCNAGALATGGYGTALGVIRAAAEAGKTVSVISCETRPYMQGARLTCWELVRDGFDVTLITDNSAAWQMSRGIVDCVIVGADRIAANGDTANKIGTLSLAIAAKRFNIPFYVAAPCSTLDVSIPDGSHIKIEERSQDEVLCLNGIRIAAEGVKVMNPSFDVTPFSLITAIITDRGIFEGGPDGYALNLDNPA